MNDLRHTLESWLPDALQRVDSLDPAPRMEQVGRVLSVGDGIATIAGLPEVRADELLLFPGGLLGIAQHLDPATIGCVLLGADDTLAAGDPVHGTGAVIRVPVGEDLLGRVVDPVGRPLDDGPPVEAARLDPVERGAPGIVERDFVSETMHTGILVLDAMFPIGRGQRELIIGDRSTGKTSIAVDTIISQRATDVISIYVAVGQRSSDTRQALEAVRRHGAFERCIFVVAAADSPPGLQWIAPAAAMTMAEYFRDRGQHVLVVIDDLTKHAAIHRELSLLLRQPPGREAYPGDVFFLHARLLERAAKLSRERGGGSLTALPIAETQAGNLSAYIPTNLISITDGQIVLDARLFHEGQKPAVDVGLSVSRVGGKTQPPALREVAERLRLEYAQFLELEVFTRFGAMADERTRRTVEHGHRLRALLEQTPYAPYPVAFEVALLTAGSAGPLDTLPLDRLPAFKAQLAPHLDERMKAALELMNNGGRLSEVDRQTLAAIIRDLAAALAAPPKASP